jgi:Fe-S-cluster containining protein
MTRWYASGLSFTCTQCGNCCTGAAGVVWISDDEVKALAAHLGQPVDEVRARYTYAIGARRSLKEYSDGDCIFYDRKRGCTVYPVRPAQCRTWPFWDSACETPEAWKKTCEGCPGAGQGEHFTAGEIDRRRAVIKV